MRRFQSNCTLPPEGVSFVSSAPTRGTLDIVWSCLAVIILCTWSVLHLNVPLQSFPTNRRQKFRRSASRTLQKMKWMAVNLLAPEWPFASALKDLYALKQMEKNFNGYKTRDNVDWTLTHCYFADMGGFVLSFSRDLASEGQKQRADTLTADDRCLAGLRCGRMSLALAAELM